jgi:magnesium chelatase family protein
MIAKINSSALVGINAQAITIEVSVSKGLGYQVTGLADESIRESLSRIAIALEQCGYAMPRTKLLIHLSPASIRKSGSAYDLPIALGILLATEQVIDRRGCHHYSMSGELGLDGTVKHINGALARSELMVDQKHNGLLLPAVNAPEATLISQAIVLPVSHLRDVVDFIESQKSIEAFQSNPLLTTQPTIGNDFKNVVGQDNLKRALEIAAAGGHNLLISGFPGTGKSMLVKCLPSILSEMVLQEMIETTKIRALSASQAPPQLVSTRPYRETHHSVSIAGLIGGGSRATPGEITYAHNGVLFIDEFTECKSSALEALRQPLEEKKITIARAGTTVEYPAAFMLVAAMNPCLCGYRDHPVKKCTCSKRALWWHHRKLSGPILDRFDLAAKTETTEVTEIFNPAASGESSAEIRKRVTAARQKQLERLSNHKGVHCNAQLSHDLIQDYCTLDEHARKFLQRTWDKLDISMRGFDKLLKVSRTIADLDNSARIELQHVAEAIHFKLFDQVSVSAKTKRKDDYVNVSNGQNIME